MDMSTIDPSRERELQSALEAKMAENRSIADSFRVEDGVAIVSTSQGVMTDRQARAGGHGGEVLCVVS